MCVCVCVQAPRDRKSNKHDEYAYDSSEEDNYEVPKRSCRARPKVNYTYEQYEAVMSQAIAKNSSGDPTLLRGM